MSDNIRFHSKGHGNSHHTTAVAGSHDSATDPIASSLYPFIGDFHLSGCLVTYDGGLSKTVCYTDWVDIYDGTYTTVWTNSSSWTATGDSKWSVNGNYIYSQAITNFLGLGTQTPNEMLTVTDNISAQGNITSDGGSSLDWNSVYTEVNENSANWEVNRLDITNLANTSAKWDSNRTTVETNSADWSYVAANSASIMPAGAVMPYAGNTAPAGWLLCDGSTVPSATYGALYAVITTTYGGDATNFALPDLRGRMVAGVDAMNNSVGSGGGAASRLAHASTLAATSGTYTETLSTHQIRQCDRSHVPLCGHGRSL